MQLTATFCDELLDKLQDEDGREFEPDDMSEVEKCWDKKIQHTTEKEENKKWLKGYILKMCDQ